MLYNAGLMKRVNEKWYYETESAYICRVDGKCFPGDIDPHRSLLIGELQPDAMIALDYRVSAISPSVVYLISCGELDGWIEVAPNIERFMEGLSLGVES